MWWYLVVFEDTIWQDIACRRVWRFTQRLRSPVLVVESEQSYVHS
jgi:hypothetical protein